MTETMNPQIKAMWIEALESGDYVKGVNALHNEENNTYCCLGVLCDLAMRNGVALAVGVTHEFVNGREVPVTRFDRASTVLPPTVQQWAGLDDSNPEVFLTNAGHHLSVAEVNDHGIPESDDDDARNIPATFHDIAALIKENF